MKLSKRQIIALLIVLASYAVAGWFYPQMPTQIASHWGIDGQVNGSMSKFWGLFLMPFISTFLYLLFLAIPKIDPKAKNIREFQPYFDNFVIVILGFLFYIFGLTIIWNLGYRFDFNILILPPFAVLFFSVGVLIEHAKPNWFIGIRTPWTLENPLVWEKTHRITGKLYKISALISLLGLLIPVFSFYFIIIPVLATSFVAVIYSYVLFQAIKRESKHS